MEYNHVLSGRPFLPPDEDAVRQQEAGGSVFLPDG